MDKDSFWKEVTDIARHHKQRSHPVEQLPKEQMEQLESTVFEHIDQLFSDSGIKDTDVAHATVEPDDIATGSQQTREKGSIKQTDSLWAWLFQGRYAPVFGMALIGLLSVGVLSYLFSDSQISESLFDIPESVVAANVDEYIQIPQESSRAFSGTLPSQRRSAFLAGVAQADLDLIGDSEKPAAHQVARWYHQTTTNTPATDALNALKTVRSSVARYSDDKQTRFWLKQGYMVEVVHLAAKRSMRDLNASALIDALQFYRVQASLPEPGNTEPDNPDLRGTSADVAIQFIRNHEKLLVAAPAQSPTPEQVQEIVDMTHEMKVLIQ